VFPDGMEEARQCILEIIGVTAEGIKAFGGRVVTAITASR